MHKIIELLNISKTFRIFKRVILSFFKCARKITNFIFPKPPFHGDSKSIFSFSGGFRVAEKTLKEVWIENFSRDTETTFLSRQRAYSATRQRPEVTSISFYSP